MRIANAIGERKCFCSGALLAPDDWRTYFGVSAVVNRRYSLGEPKRRAGLPSRARDLRIVARDGSTASHHFDRLFPRGGCADGGPVAREEFSRRTI